MQWQAVVQWAGPGALVVERHAADAPAFLRRDFANSLAAAFPPQEVEAQMGAAGLTCLKVKTVEDRYLEVSGQLLEASSR